MSGKSGPRHSVDRGAPRQSGERDAQRREQQIADRSNPKTRVDRERDADRNDKLAASTPAAPLAAQNRGVGRVSTALTKRMPSGKPKPIKTPGGTIAAREATARSRSPPPS